MTTSTTPPIPGASTRIPAGRLAPSPCHCLTVRQAARKMTQIYDRHLVAVGLRATQFSVLMIIGRFGPLAVHELAQRLVLDPTATGRALRPLERDGLVRVGPGRDARTRSVSLTPEGSALLGAAQVPWTRAQAEFEAQYGAPEADALRLSLARVVGRA